MKKAQFDLQNYLVTIIIFIGVVVTFGAVAVNMGNHYDTIGGATIDDSEFSASYNKLSTLQAETQELEDKTLTTDTGTEDSSVEFLGDALNSIKLVATGMSTGTTMAEDMGRDLDVPDIWINIAKTILILMIITTIIYMIVKSRGTS